MLLLLERLLLTERPPLKLPEDERLLEELLPTEREGMLEDLLLNEREGVLEELLLKEREGVLEVEGRLPLKLFDDGWLGVVLTPVEGRLGGVLTPEDGWLGGVFTPVEGRLGMSDEERLPLKRPLPLRLLS